MILSLAELLTKDIRGKVIVFETDTVYGLGCLYDDSQAVRRIFQIKHREQQKSLALLSANTKQVELLVQNIELGRPYIERYWPGPLTLIFPKSDLVPNLVTGGRQTVGIRIPDSQVALSILTHFGPMAVTSLNISKEPPVVLFSEALKFESQVDYIVRGNDLSGEPSTVFELLTRQTLRQGAIRIE
ncbi:MAG: L-threonylcarbamoyladenylate synthase [Candidatus Izemoplasmatales bacterium]|jgi:L-threonylcarbamoyladenylate synthase|nr:L-threonylcarbamoyladenylate synthase [Candidatus Izemoplasmatales bacterium]MDD4987642.1 L-threonylcarbamoyladenylate synthase [Candidatus Izemoplasmatales bacterium]MDD5601970.1 L-threonylcarbamoyladenylate synthase [Candidatus Izemoplasmatales bacterium]MDY0372868.1 L-threonylcarbamoyladenylate synthase [Candidatus Izemoplasmatales bacterium]NLF48616.1 threonylcarbamoyl-AMP synthase [Acholeplasmataceae bacterium]